MSKVYKGRQKLNFEQAGQYYSHAYKIGVEHGRFDERNRLIQMVEDQAPEELKERLLKRLKGDK